MKLNLFILTLLTFNSAGSLLYAQVKPSEYAGSFRREFNKLYTELVCNKFVCQEILKIPDEKFVRVEIDALTASKSGELTTVFYHCKELNKKGLLFVFFNEFANPSDYAQEYLGYVYKNLEDAEAEVLMNQVQNLLDQKDEILKTQYNTAVFNFKDLTILFKGGDFINVYYKDYEGAWNDANFKRTAKRYIKKSNKF